MSSSADEDIALDPSPTPDSPTAASSTFQQQAAKPTPTSPSKLVQPGTIASTFRSSPRTQEPVIEEQKPVEEKKPVAKPKRIYYESPYSRTAIARERAQGSVSIKQIELVDMRTELENVRAALTTATENANKTEEQMKQLETSVLAKDKELESLTAELQQKIEANSQLTTEADYLRESVAELEKKMASMKKEYDDAVALLKKSKQDNNLKMKALTKKLKLSVKEIDLALFASDVENS